LEYSASLWLDLPGQFVLGASTALFGLAGIAASACIYLVPARPAWNVSYTVFDFYLTGALLGPLFAGSHVQAAMAAAVMQLLVQGARFLWLSRSEEFELKASARLLANDLSKLFLLRFALLVIGGLVLPALGYVAAGFALALAGEFLGRYLFFISVVPKNIAASFFAGRAA